VTQLNQKVPGRIVTFYSYKGGTGRSMALANVAWVLASAAKSVLVIDWDLEAPGVHRYFAPFLPDPGFKETKGLLDFLYDYSAAFVALPPPSTRGPWSAPESRVDEPTSHPVDPAWFQKRAALETIAVPLDHGFPEGGFIDFVGAGRLDDQYAPRLSLFDWKTFYEANGGYHLIEAMRARFRRLYDYVLIDSRTGMSDTSGICTAHLPDTLVVCFTLNNQSIEGAYSVAISAQSARRKLAARGAKDEPSLELIPISMRVDNAENDKLKRRQEYVEMKFRSFLNAASPSDERKYWGEVAVPYVPDYAYEEILSTIKDRASDPKTLASSFLRITRHLAEIPGFDPDLLTFPGDRRDDVLGKYAEVPVRGAPPEMESKRRVYAAEEALKAERDPEGALRLLLRLVRVSDRPGTPHTRRSLPAARFSQKYDWDIIDRLRARDVIEVSFAPAGNLVRLSDDRLVDDWQRLTERIGRERTRLLWQQRFEDVLEKARRRKSQIVRWALVAAFAGLGGSLLYFFLVRPPGEILQAARTALPDHPLEAVLLLDEVRDWALFEPFRRQKVSTLVAQLQTRRFPSVVLRESGLRQVTFSRDGQLILAAGDNKALLHRADGSLTPLPLPPAKEWTVQVTEFVPGRLGQILIFAKSGPAARAWIFNEVARGQFEISCQLQDVNYVSLSPDGTELLATHATEVVPYALGTDGSCPTKGKPAYTNSRSDQNERTRAPRLIRAYRTAGGTVVRAESDWPVIIPGGDLSKRFSLLPKGGTHGAASLQFFISNNRNIYLAFASDEGWLWPMDRGKIDGIPLQIGRKDRETVTAFVIVGVDVDPDRVVVGWRSGDVGVWDVSQPGVPYRMVPFHRHVSSVADISLAIPDPSPRELRASSVLTAWTDGVVRVWDPRTNGEKYIEFKTGETIVAARLDPTGKRVALVTPETLEVWPVDVPEPKGEPDRDALRKRTTACLATKRRQELLAEEYDVAKRKYESCERGFGRPVAGHPK
jgi:MinD-like ATPase involved in chromosome partitioning or flagellar assembly/WD40 repeat protein